MPYYYDPSTLVRGSVFRATDRDDLRSQIYERYGSVLHRVAVATNSSNTVLVQGMTHDMQEVDSAAPYVHLNGTDGHVLLERWLDVRRAAEQLFDALIAAAPHMRDYYHLLNEHWEAARRQQERMALAVTDIERTAEENIESIMRQIDGGMR